MEPPQPDIDAITVLHRQGRQEEVLRQGIVLFGHYPRSLALCDMLGVASAALSRLDDAMGYFQRGIAIKPDHHHAHNNLGVILMMAGRHQAAIDAYRRALDIHPDYAEAHYNLGSALQGLGQLEEAMSSYRHALQLRPYYPEAWNNLGNSLRALGDDAAAVQSYDRALQLRPDYAETHNNLGELHRAAGRHGEAIACFDQALRINPSYAEAHHNRASALDEIGRRHDAMAGYEAALRLKPDYAEAHNNLGLIHHADKRYDQAIACFDRAMALRPDLAAIPINRGQTLQALNRVEEALACYDLALSLQPDNAHALNNIGAVHWRGGNIDAAIGYFERAVAIEPDFAQAHVNLGSVLRYIERGEEAIAHFDRALAIEPGRSEARAQRLHQQGQYCDWDAIARDRDLIPALGIAGEAVSPFVMLGLEDDPDRHRRRSEHYAAAHYGSICAAPVMAKARNRLIIGYFSADFHEHATMRLAARLFEDYDRSRFVVHIYSYGPDYDDETRRRLKETVDIFHDVRSMNDNDVAALARRDGVDIAVDLKGYTRDGRPGIFAHRAALLQISYLGYPGTLGAPFMDYLLADPIVIPAESRSCYSEGIVYLPYSYQVNDDRRRIADRPMTREQAGLPATGFVFCCFNNSYKISPDAFDIWMRLLGQSPGSVLWLLSTSPETERNLRSEAGKRGIAPDRLIFAPRLPQPEHLARHRLADLFLDTFAYNAHTTTSDALWAGLPVLTLMGRGFAARVAGSLLHAVGLPELVTTNARAYEDLALQMVRDPQMLAALRKTLGRNRFTDPLFDTTGFIRTLEKAYRTLFDLHLAGWPRQDVRIA